MKNYISLFLTLMVGFGAMTAYLFFFGPERGFEDFDELYWDVTGNEWPVPILQSSVTVTTPEGVDIEKSACYVGLFNSTDNCNQIFSVNNTKTTFVHNDPLNPGEGLTIASGWNSGEIAFQVFKYKPLFLRPEGLTFLITLIVGLLLIIGNWYKNGRDYMYTRNKLYEADRKEKLVPLFHKDAITTYFEPPENLRPGMLGLLIDERVDSVDITSTIIDLASRGYLQIKEIEKGKFKKLFTGADYLLIEKEGADFYSLSDYEKEIFNSIFKHGTEVKLSELKTKFHKDYQDITKMMYKEATDRGYFVKNPYKYRIMGVSAFALFFIMTFFVGPITSAFSGSQFTKILISFFIAFGILSLVYTIFAVKMTQKTAKGRELYVESLGYRTFIKSTEKYRAKFYEDENMFMKTLPYAITFGMTKKFYNAMKDMGIQPQNVGWYVPVGDFNPDSFAESLESMTTMMSSTTSTSSGSGSGGGGFSGGGAGGGGGGSW
jgi:hypothetical protein